MTQEQLRQLLEHALKTVPGIRGCIVANGGGTWNGKIYVACNRLGKGRRPKFVYRLENLGNEKLQVTLVVSDNRFDAFKAMYSKKRVGKTPHIEWNDACVSSGAISADDVAVIVKEFYEAYDAAMM